ncbi:MAG: hypothetical protein ACHQ53_19595 [Polyangiales bacterium]
MSEARYSLEAAQRLRQSEQARAEFELATATRTLVAARALVEQAMIALRAHSDGERARASAPPSPQRALDLQREAAFALARTREQARLQQALEQARERVRAAQFELAAAERALARRHADARVIERDREHWEREQRREHERAEQSEVEDQLATRKRK